VSLPVAVIEIRCNLLFPAVSKEDTTMKNSILIRAAVVALFTGLAFSTSSMAEYGPGKGDGSGRQHMMRGDYEGHHMLRGGYEGHHGASWKSSLTDAQKEKIKKMKVDYLKVKYPLKARMRTIKLELAVLATADAPDQKAIDATIEELLVLKKDLLKAKYAHKIAVRKELKPEEKVAFDKHMLKKAKRKNCRGHHGH
jgi:Spy/CpxP family protein refolding chaperone